MSKKNEKGYHIVSNNGANASEIILSGDLSLNNVKDIKNDLSAYLNKSNNQKIVITNINNIDLGVLQLVQSFVWTSVKNNNRADVEIKVTADQQKLLTNSGIKLKF